MDAPRHNLRWDELRERLPHLFQFLAGYFNQDWDLDYVDAQVAVTAYARESLPSALRATIGDIETLLQMHLDGQQLHDALVDGLLFTYDPVQGQHLSDEEWLRWVQAGLRHSVGNQGIM